MDFGQIALIVVVLFGLFLLWGRHEAKKSGRLAAYQATKAARDDASPRARVDEGADPAFGAAAAAAAIPAEEDWVGARLVGDRIQARGSTPAEIRIAIRELRLFKKEEQAKKRELGAQKAELAAAWRSRQAGRYRTAGFGRGALGQIARASIQSGRRSERMHHAEAINALERQQALHDRNVLAIDRLIAECEAKLIAAERSGV